MRRGVRPNARMEKRPVVDKIAGRSKDKGVEEIALIGVALIGVKYYTNWCNTNQDRIPV